MQSFDVLSPATSIFGNWFLEASAGTGKTFTIEHLVVRLLLESDLTIDQILVVTFTKAATRELKMRIRANLEKAMQEGAPFPYLHNRDVEKLRLALLHFDEAQIFTIHGFCQKALQEFAFEAGASLQTEEWELQEERAAVRHFLRKKLDGYSPAQLTILFKKGRGDIERVIDAILREKNVEVPPFTFRSVLQQIEPFPLAEVFATESKNYKKMTSEEFPKQATFLESLLQKREITPEEFDTLLLQRPHFLDGFTEENRKVRAEKKPLDSRLENLRAILLPLLEQASDVLPRVAADWQKERARLSQENDKLSPDDILEKMRASLVKPHFIEKIRASTRAAIIDEFQDTDPVQWEIFDTLFLSGDMRAVYLVGDPKQSIYAFRKADIYTFLTASKKFTQKAQLDTNYRSAKEIIDALNRLFCATPWMDLPAWQTTIPVVPVKAAKPEGGSLHFFIAEGKEVEEPFFLPFIVHELGRLQLKPEEVAILVRDRYQAKRVHDFLQRWNYPSSIQRGGSLADSPALPALREVITAVLYGDRSSINKALLGPFFPNKNGPFDALRQTLRERGFAAFWGEFLSIIAPFPSLSFYLDLQEIIEKIIRCNDPDRLLEQLEEIGENEISDRLSGESSGIQIVTMHASKGLEFETVFALGVASRTKEESPEIDAEKMRHLYVALTRAKKHLYIPYAIDPAASETSPIELFWQKTAPNLADYPHTMLNNFSFSLQPYREEKKEHRPLPPPVSRPVESVLSFSSLAEVSSEKKIYNENTLPLGRETGVTIHRIFERLFTEGVPLSSLIQQETADTPLTSWQPTIAILIEKTLSLDLGGFSLQDIPHSKMHVEMEFLFPTQHNFLKGFIDLWFEHEGRYYLVDWKTNYLESYDTASLQKEMEAGDYFLQGSIYAAALERYLALFGKAGRFGGAFYIFVRGPSAFHFQPRTHHD